MKIRIETLSLKVLESGAGEPTLLVLHHGASTRTWDRVIEQLCSTFRCFAYDQRGWGESVAPADGYAISDLAGDAAALVHALDWKRYVLVGHSMGARPRNSWRRNGRQDWKLSFWGRRLLHYRRT